MDFYYRSPDDTGGIMTTQQIQELADNGWEIGSHQVTEDYWMNLSPTEMEYEISHKGKKEKVKTKIGVAMSKELAKNKNLDTKEKREKKGFKDLKVFE